jgi:hypothetical protein
MVAIAIPQLVHSDASARISCTHCTAILTGNVHYSLPPHLSRRKTVRNLPKISTTSAFCYPFAMRWLASRLRNIYIDSVILVMMFTKI